MLFRLSYFKMLSYFEYVYYFNLFVAISLHINIFVGSQSLVYSQEISPSENLKHILNNYSVPTDVLSRSDRLHHEIETESKFFIKSNTIIRTGESRALGAKYLNETRLSSNHKCLTWCLETPTCNVAVYDEKNMHSCYMFDCGSPEKPLCKFTAHNFFTSSILKMSQHSYELSQWGRQVHQGKENVERHPDAKSTTPLSVDTKTLLSSTVSSPGSDQPTKKGSICHHYQFQCVNSSECIAIYNVCDGIPQCPDGSDESAELKCPDKDAPKEVKQSSNLNRVPDVSPQSDTKPPAVKQELPTPHSSAPFAGVQNMQHKKLPPEHKENANKDYKSSWPNSYSETALSQNPYYHHEDSDRIASPFIHKHSQFISANDPHVQNLNHWANDYDQYPPHSTSLEQQYNPYEHVDEQYLANQMSQDYDNGKSFAGYRPDDISYWPNQDILQDNSYTVDEFPQPGVQNLNKVIGYPEKENAYAQQIARTAEQYPEAKLNLRKQLLTPNQASDMDEYKLRRYSHARQQQQQQQQPYLGLEDTLQQRYPNYPEIKSKGYIPMQNVDDTKYNNDDLIRASLVNQLPKKIDQVHHPQEHALKQFEMIHHPQKEKTLAKGTEAPKDNSLIVVKPTSHIKTIQRTVLDFKMSVAELYQSSTTHTHEANSAILALVVGVTVSILLVILLACRMKTLRRRLSRKGRSLAHDADYLVNGMYL